MEFKTRVRTNTIPRHLRSLISSSFVSCLLYRFLSMNRLLMRTIIHESDCIDVQPDLSHVRLLVLEGTFFSFSATGIISSQANPNFIFYVFVNNIVSSFVGSISLSHNNKYSRCANSCTFCSIYLHVFVILFLFIQLVFIFIICKRASHQFIFWQSAFWAQLLKASQE